MSREIVEDVPDLTGPASIVTVYELLQVFGRPSNGQGHERD